MQINFVQNLFISFRPKQWIKNLFVFAALIFAKRFTNVNDLSLSIVAFICFCLASSSVYLINDVADYNKDREHPLKKNRPIAAGKISQSLGIVVSIILIILSLILAFLVNIWLLLIILCYFILNILYSFFLKRVVIVDVITIALGFVLRVIAGAVAISVVFSSWLLLCTFFLTLFLAIGKRKNELVNVVGNSTRGVLSEYSEELLEQMTMIVLPATLITYTLYTFNSGHTEWLIITVPVVLYGLFRYLLIIDRKKGSDNGPTDDLLFDKPLQATVLFWVVVVIFILIKL